VQYINRAHVITFIMNMTTLRDIEHKLGRLGADQAASSAASSGIKVYVASFNERDTYCKLTFFHDTEKSLVRLRYRLDYDGSGGDRRYDIVYTQKHVEDTPHIKSIFDKVKMLTIDNSKTVFEDDVSNVSVDYYHCNFRSANYEYSAETRLVPIRQTDCEDFLGYDNGLDWAKLHIFFDWVNRNTPNAMGGDIPMVNSRGAYRRGRD
jgi:hypothetical protein